MHHFQGFQGPDECVWVAGAWTGPYPNERTIDNIWRYCPDSDEWYKDAPISRPRGSGGAFFHNGKVYLVSGNVGGHREGAIVVPWFDSYDPERGKWEQLPDIPHARDHCHAVVRNNKVYVAGGRRSTSKAPEFFDDTVAEVDVYDFSSGKWSTIVSLDHPRGGTASAVYNNSVYLIGGEGDNRAWTEVDVLDNEGFERCPSLPEPRHGTGVVSCNGAIWIAGGARVLGGGNNAEDTYAFFEGSDPPTCKYPEVHQWTANQTSSEGDLNRGTEFDDPSVEATPDELVETTAPVSLPETMDSVPFSTGATAVSNTSEPNETIIASPSPGISDIEQQKPISVEVLPKSPPSLNLSDSDSENPEDVQSSRNYSEQIPGKRFGRDGNNSRKVPYGELVIAASTAPVEEGFMNAIGASTAPVEEAFRTESPRASPLAVENDFGTVPGSPEPSLPSKTGNSVPMDPLSTSSVSVSDSDAVPVPSLPDIDGNDLQNESSPEPVDSDDETSLDFINGKFRAAATIIHAGYCSVGTQPVQLMTREINMLTISLIASLTDTSPEPTTLVEIVSKEEGSQPASAEEPEGSNLLLEEELFDDVEASMEGDATTSSCFPSDALVELEDGSSKRMGFLRIGDRIKVAHPDVYSEVFFFSHKHPEKNSKFLELKTSAEGVSLTLSHDHLVYANGMVVEASTVQEGDNLLLGNEAKTAFVTDIVEVQGSGLHHPHTMHGDIVVNGVVASTFTSAVHPRLAKVLLLPFKIAFYMLQNKVHIENVNKYVLRALDATWWGA
ncbi:hypothetical protein FGB62_11g351 [Gracilaria domingensis]|nr:hypothetical protein FGB62_11g351 [Gracilaria domingensis]